MTFALQVPPKKPFDTATWGALFAWNACGKHVSSLVGKSPSTRQNCEGFPPFSELQLPPLESCGQKANARQAFHSQTGFIHSLKGHLNHYYTVLYVLGHPTCPPIPAPLKITKSLTTRGTVKKPMPLLTPQSS